MNKIYLDNNATTKVDEEILNEMLPYLKEEFGNPSSLYSLGRDSKKAIEKSRKTIADFLNAKPTEIIFTSGASESNCTAIESAIRVNPDKRHIITTSVEHASIMENMRYLESIGYDVTYLSVDSKGRLDLNELKNLIRKDTLLISVMMANNEIGNIYPIKEICSIARKNNILVHCDAVQAIGKIDIDVRELDVDMLSVSGHKIHAPKGVGVLYIKDDIPYIPLIFGHQERDLRGGTENTAYIVGMGKAVELISNHEGYIARIENLRNKLEKAILANIKDIKIFGDVDNRLPNTTNIAFKGIKGEELLLVLEVNNIYVSTGSACDSFNLSPSHVILALGEDLSSTSPIRISLGKYTTEHEIDEFIKRIVNIVNMLRKRVKDESTN